MTDFSVLRHNMVESQLRTNEVKEPRLIDAIEQTPRELFVPERYKGVAYVDEDLEIAPGRYLMEPMVLARLLQAAALSPDDVVLAAPHTVLKTSSGKIRRSACRGLYETGRIGEGQRAVWLQVLRLALAGLGPLLRSWRHTATEVGFAAWWWVVLVLIAAVAYPAVVATPGVARRWSLVRAAARTLFALTGTPVRIERDDAARARL